jgi:predicted DNA-binding transcriptional regulator AlpA
MQHTKDAQRDASNTQHLPDKSNIRRLHTEKEEAERLNLSVRTLQSWRYKGGGPPYLRLGSVVRYDPAAVDTWLNQQVRTSTSDPGPVAA